MSDGSSRGTQSVEDLLTEMRAKAEAEKQEVLRAAETKAREIEEKSRRECERIEREAAAEVEAELAAERGRILGEVRAKARSERLELKRRAMQEVVDEAKHEIERRIGGDGYEEALASLIRESLAFVGAGAEGVVSEMDLSLAKKIVAGEKLDCRISGESVGRGSLSLTSGDGRRRVENGFHTRLARVEGVHLAQAARLLFGQQ